MVTICAKIHTNLFYKNTCEGLQALRGVSLQGGSFGRGLLDMGKQHWSRQSDSQPQSHSSPGSTTPLPQMAVCGSVKQPRLLRALAASTGLIASRLHGENLLLLRLSPEVARANMM
jgi:hypothetical protein